MTESNIGTEIRLGFGKPPRPEYVWIGGGEGEGGRKFNWYFYDHDGKKRVGIFEEALTGYVREVRIKEKDSSFNEQPVDKLEIVVAAERGYVIRVGLNTNFARGFLLAATTIENFERPLAIEVEPGGENEKVFFCHLSYADTGERINVEWDKQKALVPLVSQVRQVLGLEEVTSATAAKAASRQPPPAQRAPAPASTTEPKPAAAQSTQAPSDDAPMTTGPNSQLDRLEKLAAECKLDLEQETLAATKGHPVKELTFKKAAYMITHFTEIIAGERAPLSKNPAATETAAAASPAKELQANGERQGDFVMTDKKPTGEYPQGTPLGPSLPDIGRPMCSCNPPAPCRWVSGIKGKDPFGMFTCSLPHRHPNNCGVIYDKTGKLQQPAKTTAGTA